MNWYYARGDDRMGPVDDAQFEELIATGHIREDTLVWREGMSDWAPMRNVSRVAAGEATPGGTFGDVTPGEAFGEAGQFRCAECGRPFPADEMVAFEGAYVCADCKPYFFQRLRESGGLPGQMRYGGFWIRFVATIVDGFVLGIASIPLSIIQNRMIVQRTGGPNPDLQEMADAFGVIAIFWVLSILIGMTYYTLFVGRFAATPGKMACRLKVVMSDGGRVTYARALARYFAAMLSSMTLLIGYIIAAFDDQKRTLHDHICDTRVVHK